MDWLEDKAHAAPDASKAATSGAERRLSIAEEHPENTADSPPAEFFHHTGSLAFLIRASIATDPSLPTKCSIWSTIPPRAASSPKK